MTVRARHSFVPIGISLLLLSLEAFRFLILLEHSALSSTLNASLPRFVVFAFFSASWRFVTETWRFACSEPFRPSLKHAVRQIGSAPCASLRLYILFSNFSISVLWFCSTLRVMFDLLRISSLLCSIQLLQCLRL